MLKIIVTEKEDYIELLKEYQEKHGSLTEVKKPVRVFRSRAFFADREMGVEQYQFIDGQEIYSFVRNLDLLSRELADLNLQFENISEPVQAIFSTAMGGHRPSQIPDIDLGGKTITDSSMRILAKYLNAQPPFFPASLARIINGRVMENVAYA